MFDEASTSERVVQALGSQIAGRTFLITGGGAQSLGGWTALYLSQGSPAHIILVSRTKHNVEPVMEEIASISPAVKTRFVPCDLSDQESVRAAASAIETRYPAIDVIINNAAVLGGPAYATDKYGNELQLATNHLGHFLLTNLLMPRVLAAGRGSRVINVTCHEHRLSPFRFHDYNFSGGATYDMWTGFGQSKTANVLFSLALTLKLKRRGVSSTAVHPGTVLGTGLVAHLDNDEEAWAAMAYVAERNTGVAWVPDRPATKELTQAVACILVAALRPEFSAQCPVYVENAQAASAAAYAMDDENAKALWALSEQLVGSRFRY